MSRVVDLTPPAEVIDSPERLARACFHLARLEADAQLERRQVAFGEITPIADLLGPKVVQYALRVQGKMALEDADALDAYGKAKGLDKPQLSIVPGAPAE